MSAPVIALDHFAGTGWGVALRSLGIREYGVELMEEAVATRQAAGFETAYRDVWDGLSDTVLVPAHNLYIASPPCQTFSVAGRGTGRQALDQVLALIAADAWKNASGLRSAGIDLGDDRTALVLTPLAHIWAHRPQYVALEQVPTVLPVWEAMKWVSMGEALGLDGFAAEKVMGRGMVERFGTRPGRDATEPAFTIRASAGGAEPGGFVLVSNYGTGGDASARGIRTSDMPAPTITSKADRNKWNGVRKMTAAEAATLQTFPEGFEFQGGRGKQFLQIGNAVPPRLANAIVSALVGVHVPRAAELVGAVV